MTLPLVQPTRTSGSSSPTTTRSTTSATATTATTTRTFTLYLIRHGEAAHNVEEKKAEKRVLAESAAQGLDADHPETRDRILLARQAILDDESFFDAPLTSQGEDEARQAHARIAAWTTTTTKTATDDDDDNSVLLLPAPQEVFVSPLRRALRTADLIFPPNVAHHHLHPQQQSQQSKSNTTTTTITSTLPIHVYEDLRERLTGRPADNRFASHVLAKCFRQCNFHHLRINSFLHIAGAPPNNNCSDNNNNCIKKKKKKKNLTPFILDQSAPAMRRATFHPFNDIDSEEDVDSDDNDEDHCGLTGILDGEKRGRSRTKKSHVSRSVTTTPDTSPSRPPSTTTSAHAARLQKKSSSCNTDTATEDSEQLQERAIKLFDLLAKHPSDTVAIVTHKGFLRELEHGCLGLTDTKEFKNCEVRVYRARFQLAAHETTNHLTTPMMHLEQIERLK
jgi:broad specificity phosphatase PhoE